MRVVALLRGINVGGSRPLEMAALRLLFEGLGLRSVRTYIASGNVVFETAESDLGALTQTLETAIQARFGFDVAVLLWPSKRLSEFGSRRHSGRRAYGSGHRSCSSAGNPG